MHGYMEESKEPQHCDTYRFGSESYIYVTPGPAVSIVGLKLFDIFGAVACTYLQIDSRLV